MGRAKKSLIAPGLMYTTQGAMQYLKIARNTLKRYQKKGIIQPVQSPDTGEILWKKEDLDALREFLIDRQNSKKGGRPAMKSRQQEKAEFDAALESIVGHYPADRLAADYAIPVNCNPKQFAEIIQRRLAKLAIDFRAAEVLAADLLNPDWKARQQAANALLDRIVPKLKSLEMTHTMDEATATRQERALALLEDMMKRQLPAPDAALPALPSPVDADFRVIEAE